MLLGVQSNSFDIYFMIKVFIKMVVENQVDNGDEDLLFD